MIAWGKSAVFAALLACGAGRCFAQPAPTDQARAAVNEAQDAADAKRFDIAAGRTADGSRAYQYIWDTGWGSELVAHKVILLVRPDGGAVLIGAARGPVALTADAIRPFESAVAAAGFPNLPSAGRSLCNDGSPFPEVFTASIGGHSGTALGDGCGGVAIPLARAVSALGALVDANGGPEPRWRRMQQVPVPVTAFAGARPGR